MISDLLPISIGNLEEGTIHIKSDIRYLVVAMGSVPASWLLGPGGDATPAFAQQREIECIMGLSLALPNVHAQILILRHSPLLTQCGVGRQPRKAFGWLQRSLPSPVTGPR